MISTYILVLISRRRRKLIGAEMRALLMYSGTEMIRLNEAKGPSEVGNLIADVGQTADPGRRTEKCVFGCSFETADVK